MQISSLSFDAFVAEWTMTFLSGATLYLINKEIFSVDKIISSLRQYQITSLIFPASILTTFPKIDLPDLEVIAVGGEFSSPEVIQFWSHRHKMINVYGLTETAICSTMHDLSKSENAHFIGKPLPNTKAYIFNKDMLITPIYVPGEIFIGGEGVSRGYLHNETLTRERFIFSNRASDGKMEVFYKTGDKARWHPSGNIELIGRIDDQIKLRGFRLDLLEIEYTAETYDGVKKCVVILTTHSHLVAFISIEKSKILNLEFLRNYLREKLPSYMVPAHLLIIEDFPLNNNGKIDKKKLHSIYDNKMNECISFDDQYYKNDNEILSYIKSSIRSLLPYQELQEEMNFFEMGLDSFNVISLVNLINKKFSLDIEVADIFSYPSINSLFYYISNTLVTKTQKK